MRTKTPVSLLFLFPFSLLVLCLCFPGACTQGVKNGLVLVGNAALPALFPSLVLSRMIASSLRGTGGKGALFLPLLLGLFCGFPVGAATCAQLVKNESLEKEDAEKLLFFCNNPGPAFLVLFCGEACLNNARAGLFLWLAEAFFALCFFLFFFHGKLGKKKTHTKKEAAHRVPLTEALGSAAHSFLYIMSCILFFSFLSSLIFALFPLSAKTRILLSLFLECTGGVAALSSLPFSLAFPLCALGVGWGGFSVHLQSLGAISEASLSKRYYFFGKLIFAILMFLAAEIFKKCL